MTPTSSPPRGGDAGIVFLDACCLLNLFATGLAEEILSGLPYEFAVARYVAEEEVLEIESEVGRGREPLQPRIAGLVAKGLLSQIEIASPREREEWVRFASQLDDGEAQTLALASIRGARVATDDKKALRIFDEFQRTSSGARSHSACLRSSDLLFEWRERTGIGAPEFAKILRAIAQRASFLPPKSDPHFDRWMDLLHRERES